MKRTRSGFTIVELLIVIVIIGILAAITIVAYNGIQERARAASIVTALKKIDKAFQVKATNDGIATWWTDAQFTGTSNPTISSVISSTNLKDYLQEEPKISGMSDVYSIYVNDGDTYGGCTTAASGVNIIMYQLRSTSLAQIVDTQLDDGNLSCGKIRYIPTDGNGAIYYSISANQTY